MMKYLGYFKKLFTPLTLDFSLITFINMLLFIFAKELSLTPLTINNFKKTYLFMIIKLFSFYFLLTILVIAW